MKPYAVVETGGKQYRVQEQDVVEVERLPGEPGSSLDLTSVLAVSNGETTTFGQPTVAGAKVGAQVVAHKRGVKVVSFKKKRRKGYSKKIGHRQELTVLKITAIQAAAAV
jgi:large subunit ribosomal protein L21